MTDRPGRPKSERNQGEKPASPLTVDRIVQAAIRLIDDEGPEQFSMRSLAAALDVYPAALYWHVGKRADLLALISAEWLRDVVPPTDGKDWASWSRELAHRYRDSAHRHPNLARLLGDEIFNDRGGLGLPERAIGELHAAGMAEEDLVASYNAVAGALVGFVNVEIARIAEDSAEERAEIEQELRNLDPAEYPNLVRHMDRLADRAIGLRWSSGIEQPLDEAFEFLLDLLIDGTLRHIGGRPT